MKMPQSDRHFDSHPFFDHMGLSGYKREFLHSNVFRGMLNRFGTKGALYFLNNAVNKKYSSGECVSSGIPFVRIVFEPTLQCNLSCSMCSRDSLPSLEGRMSLENFRTMIEKIPGLSFVFIAGLGETLIHRDIVAMIEYLASRRIRVSLITNGTLLSEEMARGILKDNVDKIGISLDSLDPAIYRSMRGADCLTKVIDNLYRLQRIKKKLGRNTRIEIVTVAMPDTLDTLPAMVDFAHKVGVDDVRIKLAEQWGAQNTKQVPFLEALLSPYILTAARKAKAYAISFIVSAEMHDDVYKKVFQHRHYKCESPWYQFSVLHNGDVVPCLMVKLFHRRYICGNIFRDSFDQIWNGEDFRRIRRQILTGDLPEFCRYCTKIVFKG